MKRLFSVLFALSLVFGTAVQATAGVVDYFTQGAILSDAPDYEWWYGCSPTSAGMMMGYYDINGYAGLNYANLVPGGTAEPDTFPATDVRDAIIKDVIASAGHVNDFYRAGNGASGDDVVPSHAFNSLADFMGTSQDSVGNKNGSTTFYFWTDGSRFTYEDALDYGVYNKDGMYGIGEYVQYAGYGYANLYSQYTDNKPGAAYGFTFEDYMAEIDAGRVVMIHVEGHSMFGFGYDASSETVYLYDTWYSGMDWMTWGSEYSGLEMFGVTCLDLTGGAPVPIPATFFLLGAGLLGCAGLRRQFKK